MQATLRRRTAAAPRTGLNADTSAAGASSLRVEVIHVPADAAAADALNRFLRDAGVTLAEAPGGVPLDGVVVLMSRAASVDARWQHAVQHLNATRIVPVRLEREVGARDVPEHIARVNWVDWQPSRPATTWGYVLAGLYTNPERHRVARHLAEQTLAWRRAGRSNDLLISDHRRAAQMLEYVEELQADPLASPDPDMQEFVAASVAVSRKSRRRRRRWRIAAVGVLLLAVPAVSAAIPEIRARSLINKAAIVTAGDESILTNQPEWSAANAAALLIKGTPPQQELGRRTILRALRQPWSYSGVDYIDSIRSTVSFDGGRRAVATTYTTMRGKTGFVVIDVRAARWIARRTLDGDYASIDVTADGATAVAVGAGGAVAVDLRSGRVRPIIAGSAFTFVRAGTTTAVGWSPGGNVGVFDLDGRMTGRRRYAGVIDAVMDSSGRATALVEQPGGRLAIVDVATGRVAARARVAGAAAPGSLSPDRTEALVQAEDGQFWRFGAGTRAKPTGIPVPDLVNDVAWTRGNRLIVASTGERGEVLLLPRGERLGRVCWNHPSANEIRVDRDVDIFSCGGSGAAFWRMPSGPSAEAPPGSSTSATARDRDITVETKGSRLRIRFHGRFGHGTTPWDSPVNNAISAVKIAPGGDQVAVGSVGGGVATLGLTATGYRVVHTWSAPDAAPVTALGWEEGPVATTSTGRHWRVPACPGCQSDAGLLAAVRARMTGCLTERQLMWVAHDVRRRIGVGTCPAILKFERP